VTRPPRLPYVPLPEPTRLFGQRGPLVVGVAADAPGVVKTLWLPAGR
jgi:hypothetical protein